MTADDSNKYISEIEATFKKADFSKITDLANALKDAWKNKKQVFICGNGGSAANALHIANDLIYGIAKNGIGIRATALPANTSVITCFANDLSYEEIFSRQIEVLGQKGDLLIALSGSGNSPNIGKAISKAKEIGMKTFAVLGYSGGKCNDIADVSIHFPINDMQIAEDLQLILGHMLMQWLQKNPEQIIKG